MLNKPRHFWASVTPQLTFRDNEGMGDVRGVIHAQADGQHNVDARNGVDGNAPEVQHADEINLLRLTMRVCK